MPPPFASDRAALVKRNPWFLALASLPLFVALAEIVAAVAFRAPPIAMTVPHFLGLGVALLAYAWRRNARPRHVEGRLEATSEGVFRAGQLILPREQIKSGLVMPRSDADPIVRFRRRGFHLPMDIRVPSREEGRALLKALGLDASQSVATFRLPSMAFASSEDARRKMLLSLFGGLGAFAVLLGIVVRITPALAPVLPMLAFAAILTIATLASIPTKLHVGADGLRTEWLRKVRFIGYGEIARIDPYEDPGMNNSKMIGLELLLKSGERVRLPVMTKRARIRDEVNLIHERIAEAIDTWTRGDGVADAALVRRGTRDAAEWVRALRGIGAGANADARTAPVLPERLWRIVEDPAAPPDARAGAAVALSLGADEESRSRLRAAAAATAAPKLRFAMETAASNESADEALTAALAEVESADSGVGGSARAPADIRASQR